VAEREPTDVLLVSPGTTAGWRRADAELADGFEQIGIHVATCSPSYRFARHFRRGVLSTDLAEAAALRRALGKALRRHRPHAIVYSSPQATMLQPRSRLRGATAVRFDAPAAINRAGFGARLLHRLERRALGAVRLLLPVTSEPREDARAALAVETPMIALPIPVEFDLEPAPAAAREPLAIAYAGNPDKKGLDIALEAWRAAAPEGWRLVVTGIEPDRARRFQRRRGIEEPPGVEWAGFVERDRYLDLLGRASVFLAASRYEDYGIAQLEALAAGTALVTAPSAGPYEALKPARALDERLVAADLSGAALAGSLRAAIALTPQERSRYAERAPELLRPYSRQALVERLREQVVPVLRD
jgi:glycosyltransferase involved in cell wall biosynthesis